MAGPFAKTTLGPAAPSGLDTDKGALIADVQNAAPELVDVAGNSHGLFTALVMQSAQTALTAITTAQNLFSRSMPAYAFNKVGRTLFISGSVIFTTANTPTVTIAVVLGGTTLVTITSGTGAAVTNGQINFEFYITTVATGASGTFEAHGEVGVQLSATLTTALPYVADTNTAVSSALNLNTALTLNVTIAASASLSSAQLRQLIVAWVN